MKKDNASKIAERIMTKVLKIWKAYEFSIPDTL